ncbi:MAG: hypothetical protein A4E57_03567 [Syntrophorhabdaceae bacterium PtaU1.Bin034]|nr:MAG: hypothetical protein A4E57_03567 [Syntrophorhabdaceae bacterium PtaU1.Bin034]
MASVADISARLVALSRAGTDVSAVIYADKAVEHGKVIELMGGVRTAGVVRIAVAVRPTEPLR